MRVVYYVAASLDGRIAGPGHDLDFLETLSSEGGDHGYAAFIDGIDGLVMGAGTYDFLTAHAWPYGELPCWLVTHRDDLPDPEGADLRRFAGDVRELARELTHAGLERVWLVGGGNLAGQFVEADLLDELLLTVAPTFVGRGPALVEGALPLRRFRLAGVERAGDTEGVSLRYERDRD